MPLHVNKLIFVLKQGDLQMSKMKMKYFDKEDILYLKISGGPESGSFELSPNITVELNDKGEMIGVEILNASDFIRDSILESVQAKMLHFDKAQTV